MKRIRLALSSFAVLTLAACASLQVRTDYNPQASFAQLKTYNWSNQTADAGQDPAVNSPLVERRVRHAVDSTLGRMGYQRVTTDTADFRVTYRIVTERKTRVDPGYGYGSYYGGGYLGHGHFGRGSFGHGSFGHGSFGRGHFGRSHFGLGYGPYYGSSRVREYLQAQLVLDVVDARTNELIWRGWATDYLDDNPTPEAVRKYVKAAVEKILEKFPPASLGPRPRQIAP